MLINVVGGEPMGPVPHQQKEKLLLFLQLLRRTED